MSLVFLLLLSVLLVALSRAEDGDTITCGSVVKLIHQDSGHYVHSHGIAWGSGSGQQTSRTDRSSMTGWNKSRGSTRASRNSRGWGVMMM